MFSSSLLTKPQHQKRFTSSTFEKRINYAQLKNAPSQNSIFYKVVAYSDKDFNSLHNSSSSALEQSSIIFNQQSLIPSKQNYQLSGKYILKSFVSNSNSNALKKSKTVPKKKQITQSISNKNCNWNSHRKNKQFSLLNNICFKKQNIKRDVLEKNKKAYEIDINSIRNEENQNSSQYQERSDFISYDEFENNARSVSRRNIFELSDPNQKYNLKIHCPQCLHIKAKTLDILNSLADFQTSQMHKSFASNNEKCCTCIDKCIDLNTQAEYSYSFSLMQQFLDILRDILLETQQLSEDEYLSKIKNQSIQQ